MSQKAKKRAGGRPSLKSPEIVAAICERLSQGEPMTRICRDEGMPAARTVREWMEDDAEVSAAIARARELGFDAIAEEALDIADEDPEYTTGEGGARVDTGEVAHRRLRIETRLKLLAKWDPKRYGDKVQTEHSGPGGGPIEISQVQADADDFARRIAGLAERKTGG